MPEIIALLPAILTSSAAALTIGEGIHSLVSKPGTPKATTTPQPQSPTTNAAQTAAVGQQLPTLQSLTGGSLSPEYFAQYGGSNAGLGNNPSATGNIQEAINKFFGLTAGGSTGLTPEGATSGGNSLLELLSRTTSKPAQAGSGGGGGGLVDSLLSGDAFKGLVAA